MSMIDFGYYNMDCMEGMKEFPDKYFDLAIVDPPYGDGNGGGGTTGSEKDSTDIKQVSRTGGAWANLKRALNAWSNIGRK